MTGGFNLFCNSKLDAVSGNPTLERKSLAKLIEVKRTVMQIEKALINDRYVSQKYLENFTF